MTNYNKRLGEVLDDFGWTCIANGGDGYGLQNEDVSDAKQDISSLTKELVAEAKPHKKPQFFCQGCDKSEERGYNQAIKEFEHNLLKALEEV